MGKFFFDELGWPWPIHDCRGLRGEASRQRLIFSNISLTAAQQPVLCKIKSWIKRDEHFFAHLETMESIPLEHYVKLMSKHIGIKRDAILVLFQKKSIYTLGNFEGEESQVWDCDKNWYENEFRKIQGTHVGSHFSDMILGSEECRIIKKQVGASPAKVSHERSDEKTCVATCIKSDEWYYYFKLIKGPPILQDKNLMIRVNRKSKQTQKNILGWQGKIPNEVTLRILSISRKGLCEAMFSQKKTKSRNRAKSEK